MPSDSTARAYDTHKWTTVSPGYCNSANVVISSYADVGFSGTFGWIGPAQNVTVLMLVCVSGYPTGGGGGN